jgi:sulfite reductase alpha subunit-like flavoprotein
VLIGPGTGCAPFRAFVEERAVQAAAEPTAPVMFFGCRNEDGDFLYKDFWSDHSQDHKVLSSEKGGGLFVAFSRDQPEKKIYVQDKIYTYYIYIINKEAKF